MQPENNQLVQRVLLRAATAADVPIFFEHQQDPVARHMAAFAPADAADRSGYLAHWNHILNDRMNLARTILYDQQVAGHILGFELFGKRTVGYWVGRDYWGKGVATQALAQFLQHDETTRPLYARAVKDNAGSLRVLEKCGFRIIGDDRGFAHARGEDVEEYILQLVE